MCSKGSIPKFQIMSGFLATARLSCLSYRLQNWSGNGMRRTLLQTESDGGRRNFRSIYSLFVGYTMNDYDVCCNRRVDRERCSECSNRVIVIWRCYSCRPRSEHISPLLTFACV